jgi:glycosyltransferase involved in cell wall biosynthesis
MSTRIALTVGVPAFNGQRFLSDVLRSIANQTYRDFVVRISDNGSTDATREICEEFARRDPRFQYTRHDVNRGAVWNFNELARTADTPLFAWHAIDDVASPNYFETCVAALESRPDAVVAYTRSGLLDETGSQSRTNQPRLPLDSPNIVTRFTACLSPMPYAENALYGVIRTDALRRTRLFGTFGGSDRAFLAELSLYGPFVRIDRELYVRRQYPATKSATAVNEYNTGRRSRVALREWRTLAWNCGSVWRAPSNIGPHFSLYAAMLRRLSREWRLYAAELAIGCRSFISSLRTQPL